jgi:hypothetical protein
MTRSARSRNKAGMQTRRSWNAGWLALPLAIACGGNESLACYMKIRQAIAGQRTPAKAH